jgi:hypothetical protein
MKKFKNPFMKKSNKIKDEEALKNENEQADNTASEPAADSVTEQPVSESDEHKAAVQKALVAYVQTVLHTDENIGMTAVIAREEKPAFEQLFDAKQLPVCFTYNKSGSKAAIMCPESCLPYVQDAINQFLAERSQSGNTVPQENNPNGDIADAEKTAGDTEEYIIPDYHDTTAQN